MKEIQAQSIHRRVFILCFQDSKVIGWCDADLAFVNRNEIRLNAVLHALRDEKSWGDGIRNQNGEALQIYIRENKNRKAVLCNQDGSIEPAQSAGKCML